MSYLLIIPRHRNRASPGPAKAATATPSLYILYRFSCPMFIDWKLKYKVVDNVYTIVYTGGKGKGDDLYAGYHPKMGKFAGDKDTQSISGSIGYGGE